MYGRSEQRGGLGPVDGCGWSSAGPPRGCTPPRGVVTTGPVAWFLLGQRKVCFINSTGNLQHGQPAPQLIWLTSSTPMAVVGTDLTLEVSPQANGMDLLISPRVGVYKLGPTPTPRLSWGPSFRSQAEGDNLLFVSRFCCARPQAGRGS